MNSPKKRAMIEPTAINGPKGRAVSDSLFLFLINMIMPVIEPRKNPKKSASRVDCHPKKAPVIAANLISPPPIASFLKKKLPAIAIRNKLPPPASTPNKESSGEKS